MPTRIEKMPHSDWRIPKTSPSIGGCFLHRSGSPITTLSPSKDAFVCKPVWIVLRCCMYLRNNPTRCQAFGQLDQREGGCCAQSFLPEDSQCLIPESFSFIFVEHCFVFLAPQSFVFSFPSLHWLQLRDYWADVEAVITSKLSTWKLTHLGLWVDLVEPPNVATTPCSTSELLEIEDAANAAKFREIKAKVAQDVAEMTAYNAQQAESNRRSHVVKVMHEKGQIQIGKSFLDIHWFGSYFGDFLCILFPASKLVDSCSQLPSQLPNFQLSSFACICIIICIMRLAENFMEKSCRMTLTSQAAPLDPKLDTVLKNAALPKKVSWFYWYTFILVHPNFFQKFEDLFQQVFQIQVDVNEVLIVLYIDCTKMGVLSQPDVNMIGSIAESILFRNPSRFLPLRLYHLCWRYQGQPAAVVFVSVFSILM